MSLRQVKVSCDARQLGAQEALSLSYRNATFQDEARD
jgi:hypothetical protein